MLAELIFSMSSGMWLGSKLFLCSKMSSEEIILGIFDDFTWDLIL